MRLLRYATLTLPRVAAVAASCLVLLSVQSVDAPGAAAAHAVTCFGMPATITGTEWDDDLTGTDGPDVIVTFGGNDVIHPGDGDDLTCAGAGDDRVSDRGGIDKINGENGSDQLSGGFGDDRLLGGSGDDFLGDILPQEDGGDDVMFGGGGNDRLSREGGIDVGYGGTGKDWWTSYFSGGSQAFYGGPDNDRVDIYMEFPDAGPTDPQPYTVRVSGGFGDDQITVSSMSTTFVRVEKLIFGGPGADSIVDGDTDGHDLLRGGPGNDTLRVNFTDEFMNPELADFRLRGGRGADLLIGGMGRDLLRGGPGDDTLEGRGGNDVMRGRGGADTLSGNDGADTLLGGLGRRDVNFGGPGIDLCRSPSEGPRAHSCER